ncbi:MAG: hypothetical protein EP338_01710 [Bacteroidetes bacterium]|nr:MAG: hypothetical protein EP338_01710 [Bacteroidota bacterium]
MNNKRSLTTIKIFYLTFQCFLFGGFSFSQNTTNQEKAYLSLNEVQHPRALLVLFDGGAGIASRIPKECSIPDSAMNYRVKTIGIDQSQFLINEDTYQQIRAAILQAMKDYAIHDKLYMGGFSLGAYTTFRFTEMAVEKGDSSVIPKAIFGVDPPLDHLALNDYCHRELERSCPLEEANKLGKGEARWILDYYAQNFGDAEKDRANYIQHSCFTYGHETGGNARHLHQIPVQVIHEIDVNWLIQERCRDLSDANVTTGSRFINYLYHHGNPNAVITITQDKGYRSDGRKHPHSWSIAEPIPTLEWLLKF